MWQLSVYGPLNNAVYAPRLHTLNSDKYEWREGTDSGMPDLFQGHFVYERLKKITKI